MEEVRAQYERHPYPPVSALALPRKGQGGALTWERGAELAGREGASHEGLRILVAGCGTLEALVVAQAHPRAREVVAVDISEASIARLRVRVTLARIANLILGLGLRSRIPPIRLVRADLATWEDGEFDYVLATDVLHHHHDPAGLLQRLAKATRPGGLMRLVTYTAHGRVWMRAIGRWLKAGGLTPETPSLRERARARMGELSPENPLRLSFEANPESRAATGIVDAYLHVCENPMAPEAWGQAAASAGLQLVAQDHPPSSQSGFIDELWPELGEMGDWSKLGLLDDLLEMVANPVLWLEPGVSGGPPSMVSPPGNAGGLPPSDGLVLSRARSSSSVELEQALWLPSHLRWELGVGLGRAVARVERHGLDEARLLEVLEQEVGCRVNEAGDDLPGLTLYEHAGGALRELPEPWDAARFRELTDRLPSGARLIMASSREPVPGESLEDQALHLQTHLGPAVSWIGPLLIEV